MRTEFFKDWSEEAISKKADELNKKFNEAVVKLYCAAAEGSVKDYDELRDKIIEASCLPRRASFISLLFPLLMKSRLATRALKPTLLSGWRLTVQLFRRTDVKKL